MTAAPTRGTELAEALRRERAALMDALSSVAPESMTTPGLVGDWSARELIAHLGYWAGHATESIHTVEQGHAEELDADDRSVDEVNDTVARIARQTELATVQRREAASVEALLDRLGGLDPALLDSRLPEGITLEEAVREDGAAHYREHAAELRTILAEGARG